MDLLTEIANEFMIPIILKNQKIWFFRTKAGKYYYDFYQNNFIALGWDQVSPDLITDSLKGKESKKEIIEGLYPDHGRPGLILGQLDDFYNSMHSGDLVIIPSEGSKEIAIGILGDVVSKIKRIKKTDEHEECTFTHKREVNWKKQVSSLQDIYLFKALRAQQTISDITEEASLIFRNLYPVYISENAIHLTLQKPTNNNLSLADNVDLLSNIMNLVDATTELYGRPSFKNEIVMKTAVGSPGFMELIVPGVPVAAITIGIIIKFCIGKEKSPDGTTADGIMGLVAKINNLVNDYHARKKVDAEVKRINAETDLTKAQTAKTMAEAELIKAQVAKTNEEARSLALQNEQVALLPSGLTTEQQRIADEQLTTPKPALVSTFSENICKNAEKISTAASNNGLSYDGKLVEKVG